SCSATLCDNRSKFAKVAPPPELSMPPSKPGPPPNLRKRSVTGRKADTPVRASYFSDSLARGLAVIKAFDRDAPMLRIVDVAKRTGLDRASARRFLLTLLDLGYVGRSEDLFYLRPRALDIGFS